MMASALHRTETERWRRLQRRRRVAFQRPQSDAPSLRPTAAPSHSPMPMSPSYRPARRLQRRRNPDGLSASAVVASKSTR